MSAKGKRAATGEKLGGEKAKQKRFGNKKICFTRQEKNRNLTRKHHSAAKGKNSKRKKRFWEKNISKAERVCWNRNRMRRFAKGKQGVPTEQKKKFLKRKSPRPAETAKWKLECIGKEQI